MYRQRLFQEKERGMRMKVKDWLELTKPDRTIVLNQVVEQQQKSKRPVTTSDWNLRLQEVLERIALYDMSFMEEE